MVTVEQAIEILSDHTISLEIEEVNFESSLGRILAEPIHADRDFPPYNRVAMDGFAFRYASLEGGQNALKIEHTAAAGDKQYRLRDPKACVEIMTGAVLPEGCDTVVPYESTEVNDLLMSFKSIPTHGQNVHVQGSDRKAGDIILPVGTQIAAPDIGISATVGATLVRVYRIPSICLVSTGDELVPVQDKPEPHQIRSSNVYALKAALSM